MSDGRDIITLVAQRQDCEQFRRKNWVGTFDEYLDIVRERPRGYADRVSARLRHDLVVRRGCDRDEPREAHRTTASSTIPTTTAATPSSASIGPLHHLVNALQERGRRLRHREPRAAAARPRRQQQEHDRPAAEEGHRALFGHGRRRAVHARLGRARKIPRIRGDSLVPDERRAAALDSAAVPGGRRRGTEQRSRRGRLPASASTASSIRSAASCTTSG